MEKFLSFCEKYLTGSYEIHKNQKYFSFPKVAPILTSGILLSGIGDSINLPIMTYCGYPLIIIGLFGFFFYNIFPSRLKKY